MRRVFFFFAPSENFVINNFFEFQTVQLNLQDRPKEKMEDLETSNKKSRMKVDR